MFSRSVKLLLKLLQRSFLLDICDFFFYVVKLFQDNSVVFSVKIILFRFYNKFCNNNTNNRIIIINKNEWMNYNYFESSHVQNAIRVVFSVPKTKFSYNVSNIV